MKNLTVTDTDYSVYKHTNLKNGKVYVGMTNNIQNRWRNNGIAYKPYKKNSTRFWNAIKKYGWNNFKHEVIEDGLSFEKACEAEKRYIKLYQSTDRKKGYNIAPGGNGGVVYQIHPRGMLGKHQTKYEIETHRKFMLDPKNNPMYNGKVVWGVTHPHPRGMAGKHQTSRQKKAASKKAMHGRGMVVVFANGVEQYFKTITMFCEYYHVDTSWPYRYFSAGKYHVSKYIKNTAKEKLKKFEGATFKKTTQLFYYINNFEGGESLAVDEYLLQHPAYQYAKDVVNKKLIANWEITKVCQDFLDGLEDKNSPYFFDVKLLKKITNLFKFINFGRGAAQGKPVADNLAPFQFFFVANLMCWVKKDNPKKRKYEQGVLLIGRKNGRVLPF